MSTESPDVESSAYWSATTSAGLATEAWAAFSTLGLVGASNKTNANHAWPVRGRQ